MLGPESWAAPLILGLVAAALRLVLTAPPFSTFLSASVGIGALIPMAYRSRRSAGSTRWAWALFGLSVTFGSAWAILYPWDATFSGLRVALDTGAYAFGGVGVVMFARGFGRSDPDAWLDASVAGLLLSVLLSVLVAGPMGGFGSADRPAFFAPLVTATDAAIFTILARLVVRPVASLSLSGIGLIIGVALVVDGTLFAKGADGIGRPAYDAMWMLAYSAWGAGAIHPEMSRLLSGVSRPLRTIRDEIRSARRAVALYSATFAVLGALGWLVVVHGNSEFGPVVVAGLGVLIVLAGVRSVRVVGRLADDVDQRIATEGQLRESEERFRRLAEAAPVGIFVADTDGRAVFENDAWGRIVGRDPSAGLGTGYADAIHPDDRDAVLAAWAEGVASGRQIATEHRMLRPDGSVAWVSVRAVPMAGPDGQPSGWIGTVADISSLKEVTAAAEEREAFFNGLIEQSPVGIGVYGPDGALLDFNPAKRRIRERIGATLDVPDVRTDELMLQLGQAEAIERAYAGELAADMPPIPVSPPIRDGSAEGERVWLRFRWYPLRDAEGHILAVISFAEDVTEAVSAEVRQRRVGEKLQEAAKLEALGVLAGGIAHDFNNLLVPIIGYVDLALASVPAGSTLATDLEAARIAASRAADLARQMLAYSGRSSFAIEPVVLENLLGEIGALMDRSIAKGAKLRYDFTPGLPPVLADATQLRQVALNLIVNASDALDDRRGEIVLRTALATLEPDDPDVIQGASAPPGEYVMLEVSDTGGGMDRTTLARIFDPFFSTKSRGRGLGLAATMGIVKGHGGTIRVRSVPGAGSTFQVLLRPTDVRGEVQAPVASAPGDHATVGRVLLVDDEPSVRQIGRRILERAGFTVEEAGDGPVALECFSADPDRFAGVLLDLTLPTVDGLTILRELRTIRPDVPVVLCSGWSAEEVADRLHRMPRIKFLQKPYQGNALVEAMAGVLVMPVADAY
ncbi:MAG: PAS domain-containing sensor histidine kinase [Candidatus Limnocylindrales bacterium]